MWIPFSGRGVNVDGGGGGGVFHISLMSSLFSCRTDSRMEPLRDNVLFTASVSDEGASVKLRLPKKMQKLFIYSVINLSIYVFSYLFIYRIFSKTLFFNNTQ